MRYFFGCGEHIAGDFYVINAESVSEAYEKLARQYHLTSSPVSVALQWDEGEMRYTDVSDKQLIEQVHNGRRWNARTSEYD